MSEDHRINADRLMADLEALRRFGSRGDAGIFRPAFGEAFRDASAWLQERLVEAGLKHRFDPAGNLWGRLEGQDAAAAAVLTGSHIDTVPGGGSLDGALGVLAGLECLRRTRELDLGHRRALEVVAFADEEGRFGGLLGSQAVVGTLAECELLEARDAEGISLVEAMRECGFDVSRVAEARRDPAQLHSYVELHIEQGPVLEHHGLSVGVVTGIVGIRKYHGVLRGAADHAGTTPLDMRRDAFLGLARLAVELRRDIGELGSKDSVFNIGVVGVHPGASNVVPERAEFVLELRDPDPLALQGLDDAVRHRLRDIASRDDLTAELETVAELDPAGCDSRVIDAIERAADSRGQKTMRLPSGAGHDAQMLAKITRSGMIFVKSRGGRSHSAAESTSAEDLEAGANVLLGTLLDLAQSPEGW